METQLGILGDHGTLVVPAAMSAFIVSSTATYPFEDALYTQSPEDRILARCCPNTMPLLFSLEHDLARANMLSQFLQRNALSISDTVELHYSKSDNYWYFSHSLVGFSPNAPLTEEWLIVFIFQCVTDSADLTIGGTYWEFKMLVSLIQGANRRTSRFVAAFTSPTVCVRSKLLAFTFTLSTQAQQVRPEPIRTIVYTDEVGLFKSQEFIERENIVFKISEVFVDNTQEFVDISPQIERAMQMSRDRIPVNRNTVTVTVAPNGTITTTENVPALPPT